MWDDPKALNAFAITLAGIAAALLLAGAVAWGLRQDAFAFREVVVSTPLKRANGALLENAIRADLSGTFFTLDLERARAALANVPWVRRVTLRRAWPSRLAIEVEEHEPYAHWGEGALVNAEGEVFVAPFRGDLPRLDGPDARAVEVTGRHRAWRSLLAPIGLEPRSIAVSARGGWRLVAAGRAGVLKVELGRDDPDGRLERFVAAYPRTIGALARAGTAVDDVDLRYRSGFAARLRAREGAERNAAKGAG
jgi:cell division protein FtsQ